MEALNFFDTLSLKPNFFDDADIDSRLDKEEIKMAILGRCGTLLPIYTNSSMFKVFSDSFFKQRKEIITKLIDTTKLDYNPIDNYDRTEEVKRDYEGTNENKTETNGKSTRNSTQESKVSAYDSNEYLPKDQVIGSSKDEDESGTKGTGKDKIVESISTRTRGNIGITTTQQMIESERKVVLFNIYEWIAIEFEQQFFICVS